MSFNGSGSSNSALGNMNSNYNLDAMVQQARMRSAAAAASSHPSSQLAMGPSSDAAAAAAAAMGGPINGNNPMLAASSLSGFGVLKGMNWGNDAAVAANVNNPTLGNDSLLGMASSLFGNDQPGHSGPPPTMSVPNASPMLSSQQQLARSVDVTSQVLSELPTDMFEDGFGDDLFDQSDLEPLPIDPRRMKIVRSPQDAIQHQNRSSLAVLEETLNVLNQDIELDMAQHAQRYAATASIPNASSFRLPTYTMREPHQPASPSMTAVSQSAAVEPIASIGNKRPAADSSAKRATKKQRAINGNAVATVSSEAAPVEDDERRFRPYQSEQWAEKFEELLEFRKQRGHCCVPHTFEENPALARWVKRQRYQYKLKNEGKQSTMTDERVRTLENVGFIWDSHSAAWFDRLGELREYKASYGNCNVPSNYPSNPQLATWVKCQRRQYKLFWEGKTSNMTLERISELERVGFEWELRSHNKTKGKKVLPRIEDLTPEQKQMLQEQQQRSLLLAKKHKGL